MPPAPTRPAPIPADRVRLWGLPMLLGLSTLALYWPVVGHDFQQFDDAAYVTDNETVQAGLTWAGVRWALLTPYAGNWHPLTWLSHMADVELFGMDADWHHLTNAVLHALTAGLLLRVLTAMTGAPGASLFVAIVFAAHPLHVESVAWVAERKDVLSTFWWVAALGAYGHWARDRTTPRYLWLIVCFGLALLSKPMVVTLPFVLLLVDAWPLRRWRGAGGSVAAADLIREKLPLFAMAVATGVMTIVSQRMAGAMQSLDVLPIGLRIANAPVAYVTYLRQAIWPADLAALYPYPASIPTWQALAALVALAVISAGAVQVWRRAPYAAVGWCWFLGVLLPVIGLLQVGAQPHADRFMHVPIVGLALAAAWGARSLVETRPAWRWPAVAMAAVLTLAWSAQTSRQIATWRDGVALWTHAISVTKDNYRAHTNLGFALAEADQPDRAMAAYRQALGIKPDFPPALNYLGSLLHQQGRHAEAEVELRRALAARPRFVHAHNNLGLVLVSLDRVDDAIGHFEEALRLNPAYAPARNNLALAYLRAGRPEEAIARLEEAIREAPASAELHLNLGTALVETGRPAEGIAALERAQALGAEPGRLHYVWGVALMDLDRLPEAATRLVEAVKAAPSDPAPSHDLGRVLLLLNRPAEARAMLDRAVALAPDSADAHYDLGLALGRLGRTQEAVQAIRRALVLDPRHDAAIAALAALRSR